MQCKSLWIKASAKCINVNVNWSSGVQQQGPPPECTRWAPVRVLPNAPSPLYCSEPLKQPPWSWHPIKRNNHQNYAICLCYYVCADLCRKNERLCWFGVWDIKHSFFDRVTSLSTPCCPNHSKPAQFVCAGFVPLKQTLYLFSFFRYNQMESQTGIGHQWALNEWMNDWDITKIFSGAVTSLSTPVRLNHTKLVSFVCARFVLICAVEINVKYISPS